MPRAPLGAFPQISGEVDLSHACVHAGDHPRLPARLGKTVQRGHPDHWAAGSESQALRHAACDARTREGARARSERDAGQLRCCEPCVIQQLADHGKEEF